MTSILNPEFKWTPPASTNVADTWRKQGWQPTTQAERDARQRAHAAKQFGEPTAQRSKSSNVATLPKKPPRLRPSGSAE